MRLASQRTSSTPSISGRGIEALQGHRAIRPATHSVPQALTCGPGRRSLPVVAAAASPGRGMSLQQRWRALKFGLKDQKAQLAQLPLVTAVAEALAALWARLQPLYAIAAAVQKQRESLNESYNQFLAEETKSKWTWAKRNAKELALLQAVPPYIFWLACTLAYQALTPVTFAFSLLLPLYYSWVVWDRWWASPVFVGFLLMAPIKFAPWGQGSACWVWPGLV